MISPLDELRKLTGKRKRGIEKTRKMVENMKRNAEAAQAAAKAAGK